MRQKTGFSVIENDIKKNVFVSENEGPDQGIPWLLGTMDFPQTKSQARHGNLRFLTHNGALGLKIGGKESYGRRASF